MDYYSQPTVPLTFTRARGGVFVSGLAVSVVVTDAKSNATLLSLTMVPETAAGSGVYTYNWTHGLLQDTSCVVTYTVGGVSYREFIFINGGGYGPGRAL